MADILIFGMKMPENEPLRLVLNQNGQLFVDHGVTFTEYEAIELPEHGDLIDLDALTKEINERIDAAIKWGINAIADRDAEIKLRAEQAVATFCEASLAAKKLPTIVPASVQSKEETE